MSDSAMEGGGNKKRAGTAKKKTAARKPRAKKNAGGGMFTSLTSKFTNKDGDAAVVPSRAFNSKKEIADRMKNQIGVPLGTAVGHAANGLLAVPLGAAALATGAMGAAWVGTREAGKYIRHNIHTPAANAGLQILARNLRYADEKNKKRIRTLLKCVVDDAQCAPELYDEDSKQDLDLYTSNFNKTEANQTWGENIGDAAKGLAPLTPIMGIFHGLNKARASAKSSADEARKQKYRDLIWQLVVLKSDARRIQKPDIKAYLDKADSKDLKITYNGLLKANDIGYDNIIQVLVEFTQRLLGFNHTNMWELDGGKATKAAKPRAAKASKPRAAKAAKASKPKAAKAAKAKKA